MANAGYGNHVTSDPKVAERADPGAAGRKPEAGTDQPGTDLRGSQDGSGPQGAVAGHHSAPPSQGTGPQDADQDTTSPMPSRDDHRDEATPGAGALPGGHQGGDVDPGVG